MLKLLALTLVTASVANCAKGERDTMILAVSNRSTAGVDTRIFGQFLERPSWHRERGPESALGPDGKNLREDAMELIAAMRIPLVRFPGGTDIDYTDWTDMIDNAPGRGRERPITKGHRGETTTNRFGYDEYFRLRDRLECESIVVVNFLDGLAGRKPLARAARHAAGLAAYCNASAAETSSVWPSVRAKNGREKPFGAEYFQIGNEWFMPDYREKAAAFLGVDPEKDSDTVAAWYRKCLLEYARAIKAVDPRIKLIADGDMGSDKIGQIVLSDPCVGELVDFVAFHEYAPMPMDIKNGDTEVNDRTVWNAFVAMPGDYSDGNCRALGTRSDFARRNGYGLAVTEWNWNGWGFGKLDDRISIHWALASALGTAGYIHGLMRDKIAIATQSMLVGRNWDITTVRVPDTAAPYYYPQGLATKFYTLHHGNRLLDTAVTHGRSYPQTLKIGCARTWRTVNEVDIVATRSNDRLFIHAINRSFDDDHELRLILNDLVVPAETGMHHLLTGDPTLPPDRNPVTASSSAFCFSNDKTVLVLPRRSASIFEFPIEQSENAADCHCPVTETARTSLGVE